MFQRAPGEVDALANGYASDDIKIDKIRDNLRARQQAPDYTGFLTEEEADFLFGRVDLARQSVVDADERAGRMGSARDSAVEAADDLRDTVKDLEDKIRDLNDEIEELRNNKDATP